MRPLILFLIAIILIAPVSASSMKLLAVTQTNDGLKGTIALLDMDVKDGAGRIFIDSFPLSKIDTQISTRFAQQMACKQLMVDCSKIDFFYVIRAGSSIIGGPSAGAALAVLTTSILDNFKLREDVAITGTINSGGFIGPVGGVMEKIVVAAKNNISLVLIPSTVDVVNHSNKSVNIYEFAEELGIQVKEVVHLSEAISYFKGEEPVKIDTAIEINPVYGDTMAMLAGSLCNRTNFLLNKFSLNESEKERVNNLTIKADQALANQQVYSAASYCFGANTLISQYYAKRTYGKKELAVVLFKLQLEIRAFWDSLPKYKTLTDLESYTIVVERLHEALELVKEGSDNLKDNKTLIAAGNYGFAVERFHSAESWSQFYGKSDEESEFNLTALKSPCLRKILEAKERVDYLEVYIPLSLLEDISDELKTAVKYSEEESYELCLFKASKAKAQADAILSSMGAGEEGLKPLLKDMLVFIKQNIFEQTQKGHFPIVGYSYYEYSNSLKEDSVVSAYIYAMYALELSNLDMYFPEKNLRQLRIINWPLIQLMILSGLIGILIGIMISKKPKAFLGS